MQCSWQYTATGPLSSQKWEGTRAILHGRESHWDCSCLRSLLTLLKYQVYKNIFRCGFNCNWMWSKQRWIVKNRAFIIYPSFWQYCFLKVSKFQNDFMESSFLPKYEPNIVRISALHHAILQGRNPFNFWFIFWEKRWLHKLILKFTDL